MEPKEDCKHPLKKTIAGDGAQLRRLSKINKVFFNCSLNSGQLNNVSGAKKDYYQITFNVGIGNSSIGDGVNGTNFSNVARRR